MRSKTAPEYWEKVNPHIRRWVEMVEDNEVSSSREMKLLCKLIRKAFRTEAIYTDGQLLDKYLSLQKYFPFERLFEWQTFCIALHLCTFKKDGSPRWPNLFLLIGRGAGKDGFIAYESLCLISPYSGLERYDIDICANAKEQACRPLNDLLDIVETPKHANILRKHFFWTKEHITGIKLRGTVRGRTNNPGSKDGMRSGLIVFNEIHQYKDNRNLNVFKTGQGKGGKDPRQLYVTTNGDVRDGPLDEMLEQMESILKGAVPDGGFLPFVCKLDKEEDVHNKNLWAKANPSLPYMPVLFKTIEAEYEAWKRSPSTNTAFMTKRMNLPEGNPEINVASWDNILAACRKLPDLEGWDCVAGIDAASKRDFASAGLWFNHEDTRCWFSHTWLCLKNPDLPRIKYPYEQAARNGLITLVDDIEIPPELITAWLEEQAERYNLRAVALDYYRYNIFKQALEEMGFSAKRGAPRPIKTVRPSDLGLIVPLIDSWFINKKIAWGEDNSLMRWYTNNTILMQTETDKKRGVYTYGKIEPKSRKTDGFFAMAAAATLDTELSPAVMADYEALGGVMVFD